MIRYLVPGSPTIFSHAVWEVLGKEMARALRYRHPRSVGVMWVSERQMQTFNRRYRQKDRPTDVLSFEAEALEEKREGYMGDLVVCPAYAKHEAERRGIHPKEELLRLVIHGTLHLAGYDHATRLDEARMFVVQERCLSRILKLCRLHY